MDSKRGRKVILNLTDEDTDALCQWVGAVGLTVPQLLENFIVDLINGRSSNGSDEHMYANKWFERCWFGYRGCLAFLGYLLENNLFDDMWMNLDELNYLESLSELDEDDLNDICLFRKELDEMFQQYTESVSMYFEFTNGLDLTLGMGIAWIHKWVKQRLLMQNMADSDKEEWINLRRGEDAKA